MWVQWWSLRHQDGRRRSGIGHTKSKWHRLVDVASFKTDCGREVNLWPKESKNPPKRERCRHCAAIRELEGK